MKNLSCLVIGAAFAVLAGSGSARAAEAVVEGETAAKVDTYLSRLSGFGFSGALIVEKDGKVILSKGYGMADREAARPVIPETVFTIGSITKQFTGAAIVKLEQEGKLSVSDPMTKYFDEVPKDKAGITIHQLLTHSGGFPGAIGSDFDTASTRERFVQQAMATELLFPPGTRYEYSNVGYSLLGMIVEKASGKPYEQFLHDELFEPAGMERTGYLLPKYRDEELAVGYRGGERWGSVIRHPMLEDGPSWHLRANGGVHSTILDMYRWRRALQGEEILSKASKEKLFAPHMPEGPGGQSHYGYGWVTFETSRGTKLIAHNGGNGIFSADFRDYVDEGVMFFVATNVAEFEIDTLSNRIASVIFGHDYEMPPAVVPTDKAALAKIAGSYRLPDGATILVEVADGALRLTPRGQAALAALIPGPPLSEAAVDAINARTQVMLEESARGEYGRLISALSGDMTPDEVKTMAARHWTALQEESGKLESVEILGSAPYRGRMVATTVRMNFERGPQYSQYVWTGSRLRRMRTMEGPLRSTFQPVESGKFVWLDFASGSTCSVVISGEELQIDNEGRRIVAKRTN